MSGSREDERLQAIRDEISAYLDGELTAPESQRVKQLIDRDPVYRREFKALETVWDALDDLPSSTLGPGFTQSTLAMAAIQAESAEEPFPEDLPVKSHPGLKWIKQLGWPLSLLFMAGLGWSLSILWPHPDEQLARDLPIIEHLNGYLSLKDVNLLRRFADEKVFTSYAPEESGPAQRAVNDGDPSKAAYDVMARRLADVRAMDDDAKNRLLRNNEQFLQMNEARQERLRNRYKEIMTDPRSDELLAEFFAFEAWTNSLSTSERNQLERKPLEERFASTKKLLRADEMEQPAGYNSADAEIMQEHFKNWMQTRSRRDENAAQGGKSDTAQGEDSPSSQSWFMADALKSWANEDNETFNIKIQPIKEDVAALIVDSDLSEECRKLLTEATEREQWRIIGAWILAYDKELRRAQSDSADGTPSEKNLEDFFRDKLKDETRASLLKLPLKEMHKQLASLYLNQIREAELLLPGLGASSLDWDQEPLDETEESDDEESSETP